MFAGPRPRRGVVRAHHLGAPGLEAAPLEDELDLLLVGQRNPVDHRPLVERAGERALHAGAVVAPDVDHERVLELAHLLDRVDHAADVPVGVLASSPRTPPSGARRGACWFSSSESHAGIALGPRRQLRVGRDHAELLLAREGLLAQLVPALVELALVPVGPLAPHLMRARGCSRSRSTRTTASRSRGRGRRAATRSSCRPSRPGSRRLPSLPSGTPMTCCSR